MNVNFVSKQMLHCTICGLYRVFAGVNSLTTNIYLYRIFLIGTTKFPGIVFSTCPIKTYIGDGE